MQYWIRCFVGEAPELVMEAMDLSKMMAKHKYRSWYMKIHAIISKHGFGCIVVGEVNQGGSLTLSG